MSGRLGKVQYRIRRYRRAVQVMLLGLLILSPYLRIFRFDIPTTSLYLLGMRLWVNHLFLFTLLVIGAIYVVIATSLLFGRVFCGWVCPQNLFNELGRSWEARFGRSGAVLLSIPIGLVGGFVVWSYGTDGLALLRRYASGEAPAGPTLTILAMAGFFSAALAWWRTDICRVACPYGHLQSIISKAETMHLALFNLPGRRDICATCGLCAEACHMRVDPRSTDQRDCVVCGDCLDACRLVSDARKVPRVLNFVVGAGSEARQLGDRGAVAKDLKRVWPRLIIPGFLTVLILGGTTFGLARRALVELVVAKDHRSVLLAGGATSGGSVLKVAIANLGSTADTFLLSVTGLPDGWAAFEQAAVLLPPGGHGEVLLRILPMEYRPGLYPFEVHARGQATGAAGVFRTVHVVGS